MNMRAQSWPHCSALIVGATLLLSACDTGEQEKGTSNDGMAMATTSLELSEDLPGCVAIASAVGAPIAGMTLLPANGSTIWNDEDAFGLTCSWGNDESVRAASGEVLSPQEIAEIGAISLQIVVSGGHLAKADAAAIGMAFEDGRADAIGAWIMADRKLDRSAPLTAVGPQVIAGDVAVSFASSGAWINTPKNLSQVTNDWAMAGAIRVHQMLQQP